MLACEFSRSLKEIEDVNAVEDRVVDLLGGIVLKMSEANFRPMFLQVGTVLVEP